MKVSYLTTILALLLLSIHNTYACGPCEAKRWQAGGAWVNGQVDDSPKNNVPIKGVIRCGQAADTESNISPANCGGYDGSFPLGDRTFSDPGNPNISTYVSEPLLGDNIFWIQFDVRDFVGTYEFQVINGNVPIAWELYYTNSPTNDGLGGDCADVTFLQGGLDFSSWAALPFQVPIFNQPTNFYLAVYSRNPNLTLNSINFKARNGCGDADYCGLFPNDDVTTSCNGDGTYTVSYSTYGVNGTFEVVDNTGEAISLNPTTLSFPEGGGADTTELYAIIEAVYPDDVNYSISIIGTGSNCQESNTVKGEGVECCSLVINCLLEDAIFACDTEIPAPDNALIEVANACNSVTITSEDISNGGNGCSTDPLLLTRIYTIISGTDTLTCTQVFTIIDTVLPVLENLPNDIKVSCDSVPRPAEVIATDNCDNQPTIVFDEVLVEGSCTGIYTLNRTWTAVDDCGNAASYTQTITVVDNTSPQLIGVPADITEECGVIPPIPTVTATDNCDAVPVVTFYETTIEGNCPANFTILRLWTATDDCGNTSTASQTINISDDIAPILIGVPANTTAQCGEVPPIPTVTATDDCDENPSIAFNETSTTGNCTGFIIRTWTATDACGNTTTASQTINVTDNTAPVFDNIPSDITVQCDAIPSVPTITATDNCDVSPTVSFLEEPVLSTCTGEYLLVRTWTVTDECGNTDTASQSITVEEDWYISYPQDLTVDCGSPVSWPVPTLNFSCGSPIEMTQTAGPAMGTIFPEGVTTIVYENVDDCNEVISVSFNVMVTDCCTIDVVCPADINILCDSPSGTVVTWQEPVVTASECYNCPVNTDINNFMFIGEYNGHRYYCSSGPYLEVTWDDANSIANANGGHLLVINDQGENDFITNILGGWYSWIGLDDVDGDGDLDWVNGQPLTYTNWTYGIPPSSSDITIGHSTIDGQTGEWMLWGNSQLKEFVMEVPCEPDVQQIAGPQNGSFLLGGTSETVTYVVSGEDGVSETCSFQITVAECDNTYCYVYGQNPDYEWIASVSLNTLNHYSGSKAYSNFTNISTDLIAGNSYPMSISPAYSNTNFTDYFYVFIDFNQDGIFNEPSELVMTGINSGSVSGNVQVPNNALNGRTRMRILMSDNPIDSFCSPFGFGEVEDYSVNIINNGNFKSETTRHIDLLGNSERIFPNPTEEELYVDLAVTEAGSVKLNLLNSLGKNVLSKEVSMLKGLNRVKMDLPELPSGAYFLNIQYPSGRTSGNTIFVK